MALSPGGLAGIILFIILIHVAIMVTCYFSILRNPSKAKNFVADERHHENFRWAALGLISLSWIFSVATTSACTFMKISIRGQEAWVGLNAFEHPQDGCTRFTSIENRNNPAFTFAVFNCLLTSLALVGMVLMQFVLTAGRQNTWLWLRILLYISLWCCMFTFYIQESGTCDVYDCSLGGAGVAQAFNVIWLIVACFLVFVTPSGDDTGIRTMQKRQALEDEDLNLEHHHFEKPEAAIDDPNGQQQTTIDMSGAGASPNETTELPVETTNADGSKTMTTTIGHPDGGAGGSMDNDDEHPTHGALL